MAINTESELLKAAAEASELLQQIQDYCVRNKLEVHKCHEARVKFPRRFIRTANYQRNRLKFIKDLNLRSNLAYTLILSDTVLWLRLRTDIWGLPQQMLIKLYVFLMAALCESITKDYLKGVCGKNYKARTKYLFENYVISEELKGELDWLWDTRNKMHLFQLEAGEYKNDYNKSCHHRSVWAFRELVHALNKAS